MTTRLVTLFLAFAACAIGPDPKVEFRTIGAPEPVAPAVAPARGDCPNGTAPLSNSYGTACWPRSEKEPPADHCRPARCPDTGYMLWDCPVPVPDRDASGNLILEEAIEPEPMVVRRENPDKIRVQQPREDEGPWLTSRVVGPPLDYKPAYLVNAEGSFKCECATTESGKTLCQNCRLESAQAAVDPELQDKLAAEMRTYQCLLRMGPQLVRKVALKGAPGKFRSHHGTPRRGSDGRPRFTDDGGHSYTGAAGEIY
ncbi:hypothetical protein HY477_02580, partial [Candidatus Uhrbacteria bacterium]|nr:hypothetical protein [Candidatus Uhrbacteria bacterium]